MSTWKIGDVVVTTEPKRRRFPRPIVHDPNRIQVDGEGEFANWLRGSRTGEVGVVVPPGGGVPLRHDSDWLVDRWVRYWATFWKAGDVTSDYEPVDADIPDDVRELMDTPGINESIEGRVY